MYYNFCHRLTVVVAAPLMPPSSPPLLSFLFPFDFTIVFFISIHLRFISLVFFAYIEQRKRVGERVNTKFDNTSEDMLCAVQWYIQRHKYNTCAIYFMNACARTKWMEKPPTKRRSFVVFVRIKSNFFCFVYGVVLCVVLYTFNIS